MVDLIELAERCEAATRPDRELDLAIIEAIHPGAKSLPSTDWFSLPGGGLFLLYDFRYSHSLDAAMTLVPEGWTVSHLEQDWTGHRWRCQLSPKPSQAQIDAVGRGETVGWTTADSSADGKYRAISAPLAVIPAALRAHAQDGGKHG